MAAEKILVVDDEPHIRQALRAALESDNYLVMEAENGKDAVEKAKSFKPALVILDVRMPVMDGLQAAIEIKYDEVLKNIKVIFLTAQADEDTRNYGFGFGAEMYLTKPFQVDDLLARVAKLLRPHGADTAASTQATLPATSAPAPNVSDKERAAYLENLKKKLGGK